MGISVASTERVSEPATMGDKEKNRVARSTLASYGHRRKERKALAKIFITALSSFLCREKSWVVGWFFFGRCGVAPFDYS